MRRNAPRTYTFQPTNRDVKEQWAPILGEWAWFEGLRDGFEARESDPVRRQYGGGLSSHESSRFMDVGPVLPGFKAKLLNCELNVNTRRERRWTGGGWQSVTVRGDIWDHSKLTFELDPTGPFPNTKLVYIQNHKDNVVLYDALMEHGLVFGGAADFYYTHLQDMVLVSQRARDIVANTVWPIPITVEMELWCAHYSGYDQGYGYNVIQSMSFTAATYF